MSMSRRPDAARGEREGYEPIAVGAPGLPFVWRRIKASLVPRPGAAARVPFDPVALRQNPSVTWIGHASLYVRMDGASFLVDPVWSDRASPLRFAGPRRLQAPGVPLQDLPAVDFVLLSHDHYDHTDLPTVKSLAARGVPFLVPRGMGDLVASVSGRATELRWWDSVEVGGVRVHCVPAKHFSGRGLTDRNRRLWAGFVVEGRTRRFYHAGDTAYFGGFAEIGARLGPPDLAALPIGAYEPRAFMAPVHQTPEDAIQAALDLGAPQALGMHFGTFDLADEPLDEPPRRFLAEAARRGLRDRAFVLDVGETRPF
jgi:N-acyl-phosphatidylethanolamine-hydrolysing phospholipase D